MARQISFSKRVERSAKAGKHRPVFESSTDFNFGANRVNKSKSGKRRGGKGGGS